MNDVVYFFIVLFLGYFGVHKFIDKKYKMGILYLFTVGLFGIGWIVDIIKAASKLDFKSITLPVQQQEITQTFEPTQYVQTNSTLQNELARVDAMSVDGFQFEQYCADLLLKNGFDKATVTKGSGDFGIDIVAEKDSVTYAIQCKCYSNPVGNKAVQEAYSGREYYKCMVAVVLTNSSFTQAAIATAKETRVLLWDRNTLSKMIMNAMDTAN